MEKTFTADESHRALTDLMYILAWYIKTYKGIEIDTSDYPDSPSTSSEQSSNAKIFGLILFIVIAFSVIIYFAFFKTDRYKYAVLAIGKSELNDSLAIELNKNILTSLQTKSKDFDYLWPFKFIEADNESEIDENIISDLSPRYLITVDMSATTDNFSTLLILEEKFEESYEEIYSSQYKNSLPNFNGEKKSPC